MQPVDVADPPETGERASAYPPNIDDLIPQARDLARELGEVPSRNKLMAELRIGAPKANALRDALLAEAQVEPAKTDEIDSGPAGTQPDTTEVLHADDGHPGTTTAAEPTDDGDPSMRAVRPWPLLLLALPAFVAIWSGWVGLGGLTGFGVVHPLPGILPNVSLNTAITLPVGMEAYAAYALRAWLSSGHVPTRARRFARLSGVGSLVLGAAGQVAYHLMAAAGITEAPWPITTAVSCLPVAVLGMGVALASLLRGETSKRTTTVHTEEVRP